VLVPVHVVSAGLSRLRNGIDRPANLVLRGVTAWLQPVRPSRVLLPPVSYKYLVHNFLRGLLGVDPAFTHEWVSVNGIVF
jgi:hypothetical protein